MVGDVVLIGCETVVRRVVVLHVAGNKTVVVIVKFLLS